MSETREKRLPVKRWIVLALILLGTYAAFMGPTILRPVSPAIVLPPEPTGIYIGGFSVSNTILATLVADLILILMAFSAWRFAASGRLVPSGFYNFFEFLIEFLWNTAESTAGKWARRVFPFTATIFLLVFVANMFEVIPFFDSIGHLEQAHGSLKGYAPVHLIGPFYTVDAGHPVPHEEEADEAHGSGHGKEEGMCTSCVLVPWLRVPATDLNFTFALAITTVILIQVFGLWALGLPYIEKFINTRTMFTVPMFGVIDFLVGLLELVSEFAKVLSFGFRLFGNIFAGALLILILGALTAVIVPTGLFMLEVFVGLIQAYVFSMLALVFISQAVVRHGGEGH